MSKPILCLDFDGVIHSYTTPWEAAHIIPGPPVPGALEFIVDAMDSFSVYIFSSRSHQDGGIEAMQAWLTHHLSEAGKWDATSIVSLISWPTVKPPAMVTIDDRAICFDGSWPDLDTLKHFKPWNRK